MRRRNRYVAVVLMFGLFLPAVSAEDGPATATDPATEQAADEVPPPVKSWSLMAGGMLNRDVAYAVASGTYSVDRLSYYGDAILEIGRPQWTDGSSGDYYFLGGSAGVRLTAIRGGQGVLLGLGLGGGYATLIVNDGGTLTTLSAWQLAVVPQAGIRFGRPSGIFGEVVVRATLPLNEVFVYAGDTPPETELLDRFSIFRDQAIYMPRTVSVSRVYIGVGYTFGN